MGADLISLKEFRKQIETAVLDEHTETWSDPYTGSERPGRDRGHGPG